MSTILAKPAKQVEFSLMVFFVVPFYCWHRNKNQFCYAALWIVYFEHCKKCAIFPFNKCAETEKNVACFESIRFHVVSLFALRFVLFRLWYSHCLFKLMCLDYTFATQFHNYFSRVLVQFKCSHHSDRFSSTLDTQAFAYSH